MRFLRTIPIALFLFIFCNGLKAQTFPVPYEYNTYRKIDDSLYSTHVKFHTALKPYLPQDSLPRRALDTFQNKLYSGKVNNFLIRKIYNEHLVVYSKEDFSFYFDFYPDFQIGKEFSANRSLFTNTRGFEVGGKIGKEIYFQTSYYTNQAIFPTYINSFIQNRSVVPGQGYPRPYGKNGYDFANADGYISYTPSKYFTFQLGNGKTFIGDGYRSLILSDNAFSYPFFKIITTIGPFRLLNMWTQMSDLHNIPFNDSLAYPHKYGVFQYLDWSIGHHINLGLFQNIMIEPRPGYELNYLNPFIYLVPIQFSLGSPDKVLLGFNGSYKFLNHYDVYGQLVIDEWTQSKVFGDRGYWANKQAFQIGIKSFNFLNVNKLGVQLEFNNVRPFTYSAGVEIKNYAAYNQPLADPFGTNFREEIWILTYSWHRFDMRAEFLHSFFGQDNPSIPNISSGGDIFKPYTQRTSNEGYFIGSGIKTNVYYEDLKISYMLNYKNNLRFEFGFTNRTENSAINNNLSRIFTIGLRGSFRDFYYDF